MDEGSSKYEIRHNSMQAGQLEEMRHGMHVLGKTHHTSNKSTGLTPCLKSEASCLEMPWPVVILAPGSCLQVERMVVWV